MHRRPISLVTSPSVRVGPPAQFLLPLAGCLRMFGLRPPLFVGIQPHPTSTRCRPAAGGFYLIASFSLAGFSTPRTHYRHEPFTAGASKLGQMDFVQRGERGGYGAF